MAWGSEVTVAPITESATRTSFKAVVFIRTSLIEGLVGGLVTSAGGRAASAGLDDADGAVGVGEDFVGDAADVGFGHLVDAIDGAEEFAPVTVAGFVGGELRGQALVVGEAANQVGLAAGLNHLQLVVGDVFFLQAIDFDMDGIADFLRRVPGHREGVKRKQMGILNGGPTSEAGRGRGDLFVADEGAVEARSAAFGQQVGDGVEDCVVFTAIVGPVVALDVKRLGSVDQDDPPLGVLGRLGGGDLIRVRARG